MSMLETLRKQKLLSLSVLVFTLSLGIVIGTLIRTGVSASSGQAASDATPLTIPSPVQLSNEFSQLAKKLEPSVVNITAETIPEQRSTSRNRRQPATPQEQDDPQEFFRRFFGGSPFGAMPEQQRRVGTGSGVIVDPNGYILTNNHVVDGSTRLKVRLNGDPKEYDAKLIGADPETDLAVIKVDLSRKLTAARIGNSDAVQVGDWAVAIGSPFGLEATVTAGIISAKERDIPGAEQFQHFLQTDAAINPGNSGRATSRAFACIEHAAEGAPGFFSVVGGKTTTARLMAEKTANRVCGFLGVEAECRTRETPLLSHRQWIEP